MIPSPFLSQPACCLARITGPELKETNQCVFMCLSFPSLGQTSLSATITASATSLGLSQSQLVGQDGLSSGDYLSNLPRMLRSHPSFC